MTYPASTTPVPETALPIPASVQTLDAQPVLRSDWQDLGLLLQRDRAPGRQVVEFRATWPAERAQVEAHRAHWRTWRTRTFRLQLYAAAALVRVRYVGPLSIQWQSNAWARVSAQLAFAHPQFL